MRLILTLGLVLCLNLGCASTAQIRILEADATFRPWSDCEFLSETELASRHGELVLRNVCLEGTLVADREFTFVAINPKAKGDAAVLFRIDDSAQTRLEVHNGSPVLVRGDLQYDKKCWGIEKPSRPTYEVICAPIARPLYLTAGIIMLMPR